MGISRFYRWISERYPQINEEISDGIVPQFDNLYLDVNGIAHNSVNSNEMRTPNKGVNLSEKGSPEIWAAIFRYINKLVYIAKPKKLLYIAVDGVAPRAKMNQQRSRRFRSARDLELLKTMEKNNSIDTTNNNVFDSNCITPGTTFMHELKRQLEFFVNYQLHNDPLWKDLEVILSGADVPGEGEHKIMDYIRCIKSQKDYNNNTTHCLYGLDADLIMLSLASHEPHFSLLREEIKFSGPKSSENRNVCTKEKFQFLHISILREYIINDLNPINLSIEELKLCSEYGTGLNVDSETLNIWDDLIDKERLIDDFIILGFIVGNDFLPHIPFHTVDQGLARIISSYKKYLAHFFLLGVRSSPWLLEDCGRINYINLLRFLIWHVISEKEEANKRISNPDYWKKPTPDKSKNNSDLLGVPRFMKSSSIELDNCRTKWQETRPENFEVMRWRYYFVKMAMNIDKFFSTGYNFPNQNFESNMYSNNLTTNSIEDMVFCYLEGLQWVSYYYFRGVPSWRWYYPYRYAPFACDIAVILSYWLKHKKISPLTRDDIIKSNSSKLMFINSMYSETNLYGLAFRFIKGCPLQPFEQLMGVLPSNSKELLPKPFRKLFTDKNSPLLSFYPNNFEVDMEGVKVPWGGVTLIPFIDESLLLNSITYILSNDGFYDSNFVNFKMKQEANLQTEIENRYEFFIKKEELTKLIDVNTNTSSSAINDSNFLDIDDMKRNQEGKPCIFYFDSYAIPTPRVESTVTLYLPSIIDSQIVSKPFYHPIFPEGVYTFPNFVLDNTIIPFNIFPNFCRIPFKIYYGTGINVFGSESNSESIFCSVSSSHITKDFLNKIFQPSIYTKNPGVRILVDYPRVKVAELVSIKTFKYVVRPKLLTQPLIEPNSHTNEFIRLLSNEHAFLKRRGIVLTPSHSIDIDDVLLSISKRIKANGVITSNVDDGMIDLSDPINCLVEARISDSSYINENGELEFNFSKTSKHFLLPLISLYSDVKGDDKNFNQFNKFQLGNKFLCINKQNPYYGCIGTIVDGTRKSAVFQVPENKIKLEQLQKRIFECALEDLSSLQWFSIDDVAKIIHKPLLNCLMVKCGLDDTESLKYMDNLILFLIKLLMGPIQVKCNDNTLHDISMNLFKFESKQRDKLYLPLYSRFVGDHSFMTSSNTNVELGTPIVSNEAVKSLIEYFELFPCFVLAIFKNLPLINQRELVESGLNGQVTNDNHSKHTKNNRNNEIIEYQSAFLKKIHVKDIFADSDDSKNQDFKFGLLMKIMKGKLYKNLPFLSFKTVSVTMLPSTISRLEKLILNSQTGKNSEYLDLAKLHRDDYFHQYGNNLNMNKIVSRFGFPLGTRVIYASTNNELLPFGTVGTIVSVHSGVKVNREPYPSTVFDILLDETQINANSLNGLCSKLRGISIKSSECIPLLPFIQNLKDENHSTTIKNQLKYFDRQFNDKTEKNKKKSVNSGNYWANDRIINSEQLRKNTSVINGEHRNASKQNIRRKAELINKQANLPEFSNGFNSNKHSITNELKSLLSINNNKKTIESGNHDSHKLDRIREGNGTSDGSEREKSVVNSMEFRLKQILNIT